MENDTTMFDIGFLLGQKQFKQLKKQLDEMNAVDIATNLQKISDHKSVLQVFRLLKKDLAAEVFTYLESQTQANIVQTISEKELTDIINEMFLDDTVDIIESMPSGIVSKILNNSSVEKRLEINKFLGYKENTAGSLMTSEYNEIKSDITVARALKLIRKTAEEKETINVSYVLDATRKLIGVISIRDILTSDDESLISDVMTENVVSVLTSTPDQEVSALFKKYDIQALPVVDEENRMVGIITVDDILDVIEDTATEDFEKMAGMNPSENSYMKTGIFKHIKNRIIWLTLLMISAIFTGMILTSFENVLAQELVLIAFLPLLMSTAGNCGSQVSTLMIRGMALGEISFKDFFKIFWKETRISFIIGLVLSAINFVRIFLQYGRIDLALSISLTVLIIVFVANIIGFIMPLLAKKLKLDPAVMSSPIITTLLDCILILVYFSISSLMLGL